MATTTSRPSTAVNAPPWVSSLLTELGAPVTQGNVTVLNLWAQSEGTLGSNNPLAISGQYPGATTCLAQCGTSSPVYAYDTIDNGVNATAQFLQGSYYTGVVKGLKADAGPLSLLNSINASPWCKGCQGGHYPSALYDYVQGNLAGGLSGNPQDILSLGSGHQQACAGASGFQLHRAGGCCSTVYAINANPYHFITECQAQALFGGILVGLGGIVLLAGLGILLAQSGLGRKLSQSIVVVPGVRPISRAITGRRVERRRQAQHERDLEKISARGSESRARDAMRRTPASEPEDSPARTVTLDDGSTF